MKFPTNRISPAALRRTEPLDTHKNDGLQALIVEGNDRNGGSSRPAVPGVEIIADESTRVETPITDRMLNNNFRMRAKARVGTQYHRGICGVVNGGDDRLYLATEQSYVSYGIGKSSFMHMLSLAMGDTIEVEAIYSNNLLSCWFNGEKVATDRASIRNIGDGSLQLVTSGSDSARYTGALLEFEVELYETGVTYTLNTIPLNGGVYELIPNDGSEPLLCQQYVAPSAPTQLNTEVVSMQDKYGYTEAGGNKLPWAYGSNSLSDLWALGYVHDSSNVETMVDGTYTATATKQYGRIYVYDMNVIKGHTYYFSLIASRLSDKVSFTVRHNTVPWSTFVSCDVPITGVPTKVADIGVITEDGVVGFNAQDSNASGWQPFTMKDPLVLDLTVINEVRPDLDVLNMSVETIMLLEDVLVKIQQLHFDKKGVKQVPTNYLSPNSLDGVTNTAYAGDVEFLTTPQIIVADKNTYIELERWNLGSEHIIEFESKYVGGNVILGDSESGRSAIIYGGDLLRYRNDVDNSNDVSIEDYHKWCEYRVEVEKTNIKIYKDDSLIMDQTKEENDFYLGRIFSYESDSYRYEGALRGLRITKDNVVYTLNTIPDSNGVYTFIPNDPTVEPILCQQYLAPVSPTVDDWDADEMLNKNGYSVSRALGKNKGYTYDSKGTLPVPHGTLIPNYPDGVTSTAYVDGAHPEGQYQGSQYLTHPVGQCRGRVKYDIEVVGGNWEAGSSLKLADTYHEIAKADTQRIWTELDGSPKEVPIATLAETTNNQLFVNKTRQTVSWYDAPLTGEALKRAKLLQGLEG